MMEIFDAPIVLTAGGTGGHMFPAEALAQELRARGRTVVLITDARGAAFAASFGRIETHVIAAANPSGNIISKLRAAAALAIGAAQACRMLAPAAPGAGNWVWRLSGLARDGGGDLAWHSGSAA